MIVFRWPSELPNLQTGKFNAAKIRVQGSAVAAAASSNVYWQDSQAKCDQTSPLMDIKDGKISRDKDKNADAWRASVALVETRDVQERSGCSPNHDGPRKGWAAKGVCIEQLSMSIKRLREIRYPVTYNVAAPVSLRAFRPHASGGKSCANRDNTTLI